MPSKVKEKIDLLEMGSFTPKNLSSSLMAFSMYSLLMLLSIGIQIINFEQRLCISDVVWVYNTLKTYNCAIWVECSSEGVNGTVYFVLYILVRIIVAAIKFSIDQVSLSK